MRHQTTVASTAATEQQVDRIAEIIRSWFDNPELWYSHEQHPMLNRLFDGRVDVEQTDSFTAPSDDIVIQVVRQGDGMVNCLKTSDHMYLCPPYLSTRKIATVHNFIDVALDEINQTLFKNTNTLGLMNLSSEHRLLLNNYILFYMVGIRPSEFLKCP